MANGRYAKKAEETRSVAAADWLEHLARASAVATGRPAAFLIALAVVVAWAVSGPLFHFSDSWQLVINTGTTIVTFLMVFLIQRAQNRDTMALQAKLAELVIAMKGAKNKVAIAEELSGARTCRRCTKSNAKRPRRPPFPAQMHHQRRTAQEDRRALTLAFGCSTGPNRDGGARAR